MYAVILVIFVFILLSGLSKWKNTNQKLMEKFSDIESNSMGRFERFSEIIKAFEEVKNKKPSPNELHAYYDEFSELDRYTSKDVIPKLEDSKYYEIMAKFSKTNNLEKDTSPDSGMNPGDTIERSNKITEDVIDEDEASNLVSKSYGKVYPNEVLTNENKEFLMYKLKRLGNDISSLEDYLSSNEEYREFIRSRIDGQFKRDNASIQESELIPSNKSFSISRPHINNTTVEETDIDSPLGVYTCKDLEDEHVLSKIVNSRNMDQLKYACLKSKNKQMRTDDDMVLIKGLDWSVPQERPGICRTSNPIQYNYSTEQTSLIGTLLDDAENTMVGSIMPEFEFKERE